MVHSTIFDTQMSVLYRGVAPAESFPLRLKNIFQKIFLLRFFSPPHKNGFPYNDFGRAEMRPLFLDN